MADVKEHVIVNNVPDRVYQDSQKNTESIASLSEKVGKLQAENKALQKELEDSSKKITVELKEKLPYNSFDAFVLGGLGIPSKTKITLKNVDEAEKFLTKAFESEISTERDEYKEKFEKLEKKLDEKDRTIDSLERKIENLKDKHSKEMEDAYDAFKRETQVIKKTAGSKFDKQLLQQEITITELRNNNTLQLGEAKRRESELLGTINVYKEANDALETKVKDLEDSSIKVNTKVGGFIQKMFNYNKAVKRMQRYDRGRVHTPCYWEF